MDQPTPPLNSDSWLQAVWMAVSGAIGTAAVVAVRSFFRRKDMRVREEAKIDGLFLDAQGKLSDRYEKMLTEFQQRLDEAEAEIEKWRSVASEWQVKAMRLEWRVQQLEEMLKPK